jgi:hypothetical protein
VGVQATADRAHDTSGKMKVKRTLASWLYQARNNFLHGTPVERGALVLPVFGRTVFEYAAQCAVLRSQPSCH